METATTTALTRFGAAALRLLLALLLALVAGLAWTHHAQAATMHRAAIVIEHGSGSVITRCVSFIEDQLSGLQMIQRSGIEYQDQQFGSLGAAICQLDNEPPQLPPGCFGSGPYWQYFHRSGGGWTQSPAGASSWMLHDGDIDGWHYASGSAQVPPSISFSTVCPVATPAPRLTATIATSKPSAIGTPRPTSASSMRPTPTPPATPSLEAMGPTASPKVALALTNTGARTPPTPPTGIWILLGSSATLLVGLMALNRRRRNRL